MSQNLSTQSAACFPQSLTGQCNPFTPTQSQHNPSGRFSVSIIELETGSHHSGRNPQSYCNPYAIIESNYNRRTQTAGEYRTRQGSPTVFVLPLCKDCRIVQGSVKSQERAKSSHWKTGSEKTSCVYRLYYSVSTKFGKAKFAIQALNFKECILFMLIPLCLRPAETFRNSKAFVVYRLFANSTTTQKVVKSDNSQMMKVIKSYFLLKLVESFCNEEYDSH